ncbi:hypothetical protein Tco_1310596 [Tanacetum coccineum]
MTVLSTKCYQQTGMNDYCSAQLSGIWDSRQDPLHDPIMLEDEPANDLGEELCRQVDHLRFVSNSIRRGIARAKLEVEMESQMQPKNFEIARLLDRLHYYEAINHEMSYRNQESDILISKCGIMHRLQQMSLDLPTRKTVS